MSGLLMKDFCLLMKQKKIIFMYFVMAIGLNFVMDGAFIVSYITMLGALLAVATINYDVYNNGFCFLMTLPVDAKIYAVEKHVFVLLITIFSWFAAIILQVLCDAATGALLQASLENMVSYAAVLSVFLILYSLLIPVKLKFGPEKSQIIIVILLCVAGGIVLLGKEAVFWLGINISEWEAKVTAFPASVVVPSVILAVLLILFAATVCSVRIMQKKEY